MTWLNIDHDIIEVDGHGPRAIGEAVERFVCEYLGLEPDGNEYYDALVAPVDIPVQIKGASWRVENGYQDGAQKHTTGRFRLYESDHEKLLDTDGFYAFLVYEEHRLGLIPLWVTLLPAAIVGEKIEGWYDNAGTLDRKAEGADYRLYWPKVFPGLRGPGE